MFVQKKKKRDLYLTFLNSLFQKKNWGKWFPFLYVIRFTFIITFSSSSESENTFETAKIKNASKGI